MVARSTALLSALTAGAVWCGPGLAPHWPRLARALNVPRRLGDGRGVALTFDDGPHPEGTPLVLETLARRGIPAVFFLIGEQVERYPVLAAEIAHAGHQVAIHGYRHRNQMLLPPAEFARDLRTGIEVVEAACGQRPLLYRPPYGIFTFAGLSAVRQASLQPLLWSRWGRDWRAHAKPGQIARLISRDLGGGDVVLLHDADWYSSPGSHRRTATALPLILDLLEQRGLEAVLP